MLPARIHYHIITGLSLRSNVCGDQRAALWELTRRMTRHDGPHCGPAGCGKPSSDNTPVPRPTRRADEIEQGGRVI